MKIRKYDGTDWVQQYPEVNVDAIVTSNDPDTATGTASDTFLRGDGSWQTVASSFNGGTITNNLRIESGSFASLILDRSTTGSGSVVQFENNNGLIGGIGAFGDDGLQFRTADGTQMVLDSNNRLGIGTTSPTSPLTVAGTIESLPVSTTEGGDLRLRAATGKSYRYTIDNFSDNLRFIRQDESSGGNGQVRMFIDSAGKVGIGTTGPSYGLDVYANDGEIRAYGTTAKIWAEASDAGQASFELKNTENHFRIITDNGSYIIYDQTDAAERFRIDTSGVVSMGSGNTAIHKGNRADTYEFHDASDLAVGWYTIATNTGDRAIAKFGLRDTDSSRHQSVIFYAAHHFGNDDSNTITVLHNSRFGTSPFRKIRIKEGGTYDGAALQIYIDNAQNNVRALLLADNFQSSGWVLKDWVGDAIDPQDVDNWSSMTSKGEIDLDQIDQGGIATTGNIYAGANMTQYRVLTTNDEGSGNGIDADTVDGIQASSFLRSDATDSASGNITFSGQLFLTGGSNQINGHHYFTPYDANGNHYPHYKQGSNSNGAQVNMRVQDENGTYQVFYIDADSNDMTWRGNKIWNAGNDGTGSGLSADNLRGYLPQETAAANSIAKRDGNGDLKVRDIRAEGAVYSNFDQGNVDAYVYFADTGSQTAHWLRFDTSAQQFGISNRLVGTAGRLGAIESNGSDVDKVNFQLSGTTLTITTS